ncbi:MAG: histidinol-phosphate transaminase [Gammaproteobacteria bacterium]
MSSKTPAELMAPWIRDLKPYSVEDVHGMIKLDAMENPYSFPAELLEPWMMRLEKAQVNRYPDPRASDLKRALAEHLKLPSDADIMVGNGSDELIHMLCLAFNRPGAMVMSPAPSFAVYPLAAKAVNMSYVGVPLDPDSFELDVQAFCDAIDQHEPSIIFIASPNNPTGNRFSDEHVRSIAEKTDGLLVLDEAYWRFAKSNSISELFDIENIVFMHTLSKIGLAGVRLGALIARPQWLDPLERVRMPYNVSSLTQATACFALENDSHFQPQVDKICRSREQLSAELAKFSRIRVWPSVTNFILFRVDDNGTAVHQALAEAGIAVKNLHGAHPSLDNCLRVSIGTEDENRAFLDKLSGLLA